MLLREGEDHPLALHALGYLTFVTVLGAAYGDLTASLVGVKQFFIGVVYLLLFAGQPFPARTLLTALGLVQAYALIQALWFLITGSLPPWDMAYVRELLETWGARNLYKEGLLRPFATFASFSEYYIAVHMLVLGLFLLLILLLVYEWLGYVLAQFPYTRPWGQWLSQFLIDLVAGLVCDETDVYQR